MKFSSLGLAPALEQAITACGYDTMTPVQSMAIVPARRGKDLLVNAQTGTGKTAAFALPILQQLLDKPETVASGHVRSLILSPTRELAEQLAATISAYAQFTDFSVTAFYGGVKMGGQANKLRAGIDILISTPGRLLEHMALSHVSLAKVQFVVLDEADRMLDMGFISDVQKIMQHCNTERQTMLFSATTSPAVNELSHRILKNHEEIRATALNSTADTVEHVMYPTEESRKIDLFKALLKQHNWFQVLVFTSTKDQADRLMAALKIGKIDAAVCHGDKSQGSRRRAIADFKSAKIQVLIATEVAARGLDIQGLDVVVNYNLPYLPEDYVHRIGRTGRAGASGLAISFVSREEEIAVERIQKLIGSKITRVYKTGFEVSDRSSLLKNISRKPSSTRSNKASAIDIDNDAPKEKRTNKASKPTPANKRPATPRTKKKADDGQPKKRILRGKRAKYEQK